MAPPTSTSHDLPIEHLLIPLPAPPACTADQTRAAGRSPAISTPGASSPPPDRTPRAPQPPAVLRTERSARRVAGAPGASPPRTSAPPHHQSAAWPRPPYPPAASPRTV